MEQNSTILRAHRPTRHWQSMRYVSTWAWVQPRTHWVSREKGIREQQIRIMNGIYRNNKQSDWKVSLQWCYIHGSFSTFTAVVLRSLEWCFIRCSGALLTAMVLYSLQLCYSDCAGAVFAVKKLSDYPIFPLGQIGRGVKLNTYPSYSARLRVNDGCDLDKFLAPWASNHNGRP